MASQKGFAHVLLITGLVLALVGALSFVFWQNFIYKEPVATKTEVVKQSDATDNYEPIIPSGWVVRQNKEPAFSYAVPSGEVVAYEVYKIGEMIHVGYGAPVYVMYSLSDKWQTYDTDSSNKPTIKRDDNLVKSLAAKVEDKYNAAYFSTGDGQGGETRILVAVGAKVYQFSFTGKIQTEEFVSSFVKTVKFD